MPHSCSLLCVWHINKNILACASLAFPTEDLHTSFMHRWNTLITTSTEVEYQQQLSELRSKFNDEYGSFMSYLEDTWIPHHTKFIAAWTKQWLHLGNTTTSCVEGAHHTLKSYLQVSTGDLKVVVDQVILLLTGQVKELRSGLEIEWQRTPVWLTIPLFCELLSHITLFALQQIYQQYKIAKQAPLLCCTNKFYATMGLPCAHWIQDQLWRNDWLHLDNVHRQWYFNPYLEVLEQALTLDSLPAQPRG